MLSDKTRNEIVEIWDRYVDGGKVVLDTKGRVIKDINGRRQTATLEIKLMISAFFNRRSNLHEFKTFLDGYNKRNNLWGFSATKGQMFFNQLVKSGEQNRKDDVSDLIRESIREPKDIKEALEKLKVFEKYVRDVAKGTKDKRKVPNPSSVGYFLSYFWQIHNYRKWPIVYTSLTRAFTKLGIWNEHSSQSEAYRAFYDLNEEIKLVLHEHTHLEIDNWDLEHAFWQVSGQSLSARPKTVSKAAPVLEPDEIQVSSTFELADYLIPRVASLVELGAEVEKSKASRYEKLVAEIFGFLGFDVELFGQGAGRNPDAILRFREENTAFIVDAKAYSGGYSMGVDDRAIKEYIAHHCPQLQKEGYTKVGFIIVSNSFKSNLEGFINDITWNTELKRFILLTSEALLYLLAYKTKDNRDLATMIERLVSMGSLVEASSVIEKFDDI